MKILKPSHKYELANFDNPEAPGQVLQFIEKASNYEYGPATLVNDGTTNEEVLSMLIDRLSELNHKMPCRENSIAITKMQEALMWLNFRTVERRTRGVEGTMTP